ncbi:MAG: DNA cytosine methyltransferase [Planctomycetota bacterium]|jgi:DNA (cytosine-5)-methyltransferase 1
MKAFVGFAGFGGVDIALREFGYQVVGVEIDPDIAAVNRYNGGDVITADLLAIDPAAFADYELYHFSPPCPNFSIAKSGAAEQGTDLALAHKICEFIRVGRPRFFTLENVWLYRMSLSWLLIWYTLLEEGYGVDTWNLNAADYGVPQTRRRMIAIARRDGRRPTKPWPTHSKNPDMFTQPWNGWYEAIEDLISDLPETQFAPWQSRLMPEELKSWLVGHSSTNLGLAEAAEPAFTVTAQRSRLRGFILGQGKRSKLKGDNHPADTVTGSTNQTGVKAFVVNSQNTNRPLTVRLADDPMFSVVSSDGRRPSAIPKAVIIDCQNNGSPDRYGRRGLTIRQMDEPTFTVTASANRPTIRAGLATGRTVSMTPRCLARFQSFPNWFALPTDKAVTAMSFKNFTPRELACRGIGNAVPPLLYGAILGEL